MTDLDGVDSIVDELRACTADELPDVRASFVALAADTGTTAWWRALAEAAVVAIDRIADGVDPAESLDSFATDLIAVRVAGLAAVDSLDGSRSKARRRRRSAP